MTNTVKALIVHTDKETGNLIHIEQPEDMNLLVFEKVVQLLNNELTKAKGGITLSASSPPEEMVQELMAEGNGKGKK
jgi:hypothetical protein